MYYTAKQIWIQDRDFCSCITKDAFIKHYILFCHSGSLLFLSVIVQSSNSHVIMLWRVLSSVESFAPSLHGPALPACSTSCIWVLKFDALLFQAHVDSPSQVWAGSMPANSNPLLLMIFTLIILWNLQKQVHTTRLIVTTSKSEQAETEWRSERNNTSKIQILYVWAL